MSSLMDGVLGLYQGLVESPPSLFSEFQEGLLSTPSILNGPS